MPIRVHSFDDAGLRTPKHGLVVKDADGREFWLPIVRSGEAAAENTDVLARGIRGVAMWATIMPALIGVLGPPAAELVRALARSGSAVSSRVGGPRTERDRQSPDC